MNNQFLVAGRFVVVGAVAILAGTGVATFNMLSWYYAQSSLALTDEANKLSLVSSFFLSQALATTVVLIGAYFVFRALVKKPRSLEAPSIGSVLSDALASGKPRNVGILAATAYAVVYAFASSLVVFQPGVDFARVYGASSTSLTATVCCGNIGTTPSLILFLLPQAHLALQLIPLNVLFVALVPLLVGLNFTVAAYSVGVPARRSGRWLGSIGVLAGLFTACPTCAGYFLAGAIGGLGATALAVALAPFQMLFISISIPLLLASPLVVASRVRNSMITECTRQT